MKKYYYNSFRGFSNEAEIISVDQKNNREVKLFEAFWNRYAQSQSTSWQLEQITAKKAREITSSNRRLRRNYEQIGMNLHCNPVGPTEIITATEAFAEV